MGKPKIYIDGQAGTTGLQIYQRLGSRQDIELLTIDPDKRKDPQARRERMAQADLTFFCLPDDAAREAAALAEETGTRIIDASTAHRTDPNWTYGLPELHGRRESIRKARRVANPGCYATGAITLIRPLVEGGLLSPDYPLDIHALSGYTGGGNKTVAQYEAPDRDGELDAPRHYALGLSHKHLPEIMAQGGVTHTPIFCPIICDFPQGMVVAIPLHLSADAVGALEECYRDYYRGERLVGVTAAPESGFFGTNQKAGRDDLEILVCAQGDRAVVMSRLDNLGKGASGAAVQNMNLMLGFDELTGLSLK